MRINDKGRQEDVNSAGFPLHLPWEAGNLSQLWVVAGRTDAVTRSPVQVSWQRFKSPFFAAVFHSPVLVLKIVPLYPLGLYSVPLACSPFGSFAGAAQAEAGRCDCLCSCAMLLRS